MLGRPAEAEVSFRAAAGLAPGDDNAWNNLGNALVQQGRTVEATAAYRQAVAVNAGNADASSNLALLLERDGRMPEAQEAYRQALLARPDHSLANYHLGNLLIRLAKPLDALTHLRRAIDSRSPWPECANSLGVALQRAGFVREAAEQFRSVTVESPGYADAWMNLGASLTFMQDYGGSIRALEESLRLRPHHAPALRNLSVAFRGAGRITNAVIACRQAIEAQPGFSEAYNTLGTLHQSIGEIDEAIAAYRYGLALSPKQAATHSNLLFALHYSEGTTPQQIFAEHLRFREVHAGSLPTLKSRDRRDGGAQPLRVGYVSPDFRRHPVGHFLLPVLQAHDRTSVKVHCYHTAPCEDDRTPDFANAADVWRNATGWNDSDLADCIAGDEIDILIDLSGHTAGNRLLVFARKPAPVQATWLGYFDTTGLDAIDYLIADRWVCPQEAPWNSTERVSRLPDCYLCYRGPADAPEPRSKPGGSPLVYGCFNNLSKMTPQTIRAWCEILHRSNGSVLMLKCAALADATVRDRVFARFKENGLEAGRLELLGPSPQSDVLARYADVDVALDPFPYNGGTTSCEALWMGVPLVTLAGSSFAGRVGVTILRNAGCSDWIASSHEAYMQQAVSIGRNLDERQRLRPLLRDRVRTSPLGNIDAFTKNLESAYQRMWSSWCSGN